MTPPQKTPAPGWRRQPGRAGQRPTVPRGVPPRGGPCRLPHRGEGSGPAAPARAPSLAPRRPYPAVAALPAAPAAVSPPTAGALNLPRPRSPSRRRRGGSSHPGVGPGSPGRLQPLGTRTPRSPTPDPPSTPAPAARHRPPTPHPPSPGARRVLASPAPRPQRALPRRPGTARCAAAAQSLQLRTRNPVSREHAQRRDPVMPLQTPLLRVFGAVGEVEGPPMGEGGGASTWGGGGAAAEICEDASPSRWGLLLT